MIPTLILFGVVLGQWWRWTLSVAAIGWRFSFSPPT
jgi:hypothetical protein